MTTWYDVTSDRLREIKSLLKSTITEVKLLREETRAATAESRAANNRIDELKRRQDQLERQQGGRS